MKERFLDVIKWGLILIIAGAVFYVVCPRYEFGFTENGVVISRCDKITGGVELFNRKLKRYEPFGDV